MRGGHRALLYRGCHAGNTPAVSNTAFVSLSLKRAGVGAGMAVDVLYDGREAAVLEGPRVATANTHGTGCTTAAAIAAELAKGAPPAAAVRAAKAYVAEALRRSAPLAIGTGRQRPMNHG